MTDDYLELFWQMQSASCTADVVELIVPRMSDFAERHRLTEAQHIELVRLVAQISMDVMERCRDLMKDTMHDILRDQKRVK